MKNHGRIIGQYLQKSTSGHLRKSALPFPPKHTLKQMRCNGDSLDKILVHKYHNLTETNVDLLSEIIVSGSLCAAKNWHRVTLSLQRLRSKQKHLKSLWKAVHWREKFLYHNVKSIWNPDSTFFALFPWENLVS